MKKAFLAMLISMSLAGCSQQTFKLKNEPVKEASEVATQHFFISGVGQKKTMDAAAICGGADRVVRTEVQSTFINVLLGFVTFGIYTPIEARVYCS